VGYGNEKPVFEKKRFFPVIDMRKPAAVDNIKPVQPDKIVAV